MTQHARFITFASNTPTLLNGSVLNAVTTGLAGKPITSVSIECHAAAACSDITLEHSNVRTYAWTSGDSEQWLSLSDQIPAWSLYQIFPDDVSHTVLVPAAEISERLAELDVNAEDDPYPTIKIDNMLYKFAVPLSQLQQLIEKGWPGPAGPCTDGDCIPPIMPDALKTYLADYGIGID